MIKIEDLHFEMPKETIDEKNFDVEKWRKEHPLDYLKAAYLINAASNKDEVFWTIYEISRLCIPETLYKYIPLTSDEKSNEKKFDTLIRQKLYLSDIKSFNDPFDGKAFFYDAEKLKGNKRLAHCNGRLIDDFSAYSRVVSLTANVVNSMPMWAHYANNHRGFCVSYDMKYNTILSSSTFPVQYMDQRIDITSLMDYYAKMLSREVEIQSAIGRKEILVSDLSMVYIPMLLCNVKHFSWSYEKEFRCTMGASAEGMPYVDAKPKEIYIGMNCGSEHAQKLTRIASDLKIPIHQMKFDECASSYDLTF